MAERTRAARFPMKFLYRLIRSSGNQNPMGGDNDQYRQLVEEALVGVYIIQENRFVYCNPKMSEIFGYTPEEIVQTKTVRDLTDPSDYERVRDNLRKRFEGAVKSAHYSFRGRKKDGQIIDVEVFGSRIVIQGKPAVIGSLLDITERKRAEEALQEKAIELLKAKESAESASRIKSEFLDIAAHELRTPLAPITILIDDARRKIAEGKAVPISFFDHIDRQIRRLTGLVDDLLNVSRLERGGFVLHIIRADLSPIVRECVDEFRSRAKNRTFTLDGATEEISVDVDPTRIHQLLGNFLDNALKYTPEASPIEVTIEKHVKRVRVSVIDHGQGISKDRQAGLFTRFYRILSDVTLRSPGLGLGLYICQRIAELHGGSVGVESEKGKGSTFYFELPREEVSGG